MRILYDATPLLMRSAGVKNYHHALLVRLLPRIAPHSLKLFPFLSGLGRNRNEHSNYSTATTLPRLGAVLADNYLRLPVGRWASRHADLFHITHHLLRPPDRASLRLTSFIHDPTPVLMPEFHTPSNVRYFRHFIAELAPKLAGVIVPSEAVKRDLVEKLGFAGQRITVIPHGVDEQFFRASPSEPDRGVSGLPERYVLSLGAMEPRKNLSTLLAACRLLPEELRRSYPLVIAGASGWKNDKLRAEIAALPEVRAIGYVEPQALPLVYAGASAFIFPSLYEGFGMPLLEAMAAGVPVVTSNISAMPEVVGDAGLTIDPRSASELARAIERVLTDRELASLLAERGTRRARELTWEKTALATKAFFERVGN